MKMSIEFLSNIKICVNFFLRKSICCNVSNFMKIKVYRKKEKHQNKSLLMEIEKNKLQRKSSYLNKDIILFSEKSLLDLRNNSFHKKKSVFQSHSKRNLNLNKEGLLYSYGDKLQKPFFHSKPVSDSNLKKNIFLPKITDKMKKVIPRNERGGMVLIGKKFLPTVINQLNRSTNERRKNYIVNLKRDFSQEGKKLKIIS